MQAPPPSSHSFSQGRPTGHVFQTVSSAHIAPAQRYDYWSDEIIRSAQTALPTDRQRRNFKAKVTSLATLSGEMHLSQSDAFTVHLTPKTIRQAPCDELALMLMVKGQATQVFEDGSHLQTQTGEFFLLDGRRPMSLSFTQNTAIQIDLSRPMLESVLPRDMPDSRLITQALAQSPLARLLRDHLCQLPDIAAGMAPREQLALLDASESFAIATIDGAFSSAFHIPEQGHAALLAGAQRYIRRHLANGELDPAAVAAAIGCSRSRLYQLFSENGLTVRGYIQEMRLQQLLQLLQKEHVNIPIQELARRCGLYDSANLNRIFRKRFGMRPSDARPASGQAPDSAP